MSSQAEELLEGLAETEEHIVIGEDRSITVPAKLRRIAVQFDHNVETVTFDCPRYWDGHDLSQMKIYINCMRADGEKLPYLAKNVVVDQTNNSIIHFDWTIEGFFTEVKGSLTFLVCAKKTGAGGVEENHWNSELNREFSVSEGMECDEDAVVEENKSIITDLLTRMDELEGYVEEVARLVGGDA